LLKETVPKVSRVAVLWNPSPGNDQDEVKQTELAAQALKVKIQVIGVKDPRKFQSAYAEIGRESANALVIIAGAFTLFHRKELIELGVKNRLPTMCE